MQIEKYSSKVIIIFIQMLKFILVLPLDNLQFMLNQCALDVSIISGKRKSVTRCFSGKKLFKNVTQV